MNLNAVLFTASPSPACVVQTLNMDAGIEAEVLYILSDKLSPTVLP